VFVPGLSARPVLNFVTAPVTIPTHAGIQPVKSGVANRVITAPHYATDQEAVRAAWPPQAEHLDLLEPFARIREALAEAQKGSRQAA
jgi:hypothetical protein